MKRTLGSMLAVMVVSGCSSAPQPAVPAVAPAAVAEARVSCAADPMGEASFPDANLERAIRAALRVSEGERLTCHQLAGLSSLHAPDAHIEDLTGIESLINLEELYVYGNNAIQDLGPLRGLTALRDLNLARNAIEDVGPLASLQTLTSLSLYGNPIQDISPLGVLTGLVRLNVEHVPGAADLGPLRHLTALARLEAGGTSIVDVRPLTELRSLNRLSLRSSSALADIGPLRHLVRLETLILGGTSVADITPLADLTELVSLDLQGTSVRDLGALIGLTRLSRLDLRGTRELVDIQPLLFNTGLGEGDAVRLERTGVSCEDVASLEGRGVTVLANCE